MRVSPRRAGVVAGAIAGVYLVAVLAVGGVPDWLLALFGGPGGVARRGGLVLRYRLPADHDLAKLERSIERRGATVRREGPVVVVEAAGVSEAEANDVAALLTGGAIEYREVLEDSWLASVTQYRRGGDVFVAPGVQLESDFWRETVGHAAHSVPYLIADSAAELSGAFEQLRANGWVPPPHTVLAFEAIAPDIEAEPGRRRWRWRSHLLGDEVLLDGDAIAGARRVEDPYTGRPVVMVDFTASGAERFGEVTARLVGHKLATLLGDQVRSAPIIAGPIRGGHASISVRVDGDLQAQEREADALAAALSVVPLPPGGVIENQSVTPPASITALLALTTVATAILGGALIGLLVGLVVGFTRPSWQPRPSRRTGRLALDRFAVTLLAPAAWLVLSNVSLPGTNHEDLVHLVYMASRGGSHVDMTSFSVAALGVTPIIAAFIFVELVSLATTRWRRLRLQPAARIRMGSHVALLGVLFAVVQGYLALRYFEALQRGRDIEFLTPGLAAQLTLITSLVAGTMLMVIVAGMIRQYGLGNGYTALIISSWAIPLIDRISDAPTPGHALGLVTLAAIGAATVALLRMRIGEDDEPALRVPSSGQIPFASTGTVVGLWTLARVGLVALAGGTVGFLVMPTVPGWLVIGLLVVLVPLWSFAFSRPAILAPLAAHTQLAPPSQASWRRATLLSLVVLLLIGAASLVAAMTHVDARLLCEATTAMLAAAFVLDVVDQARVRRADLVVAWPLHQAQHAELVRRVLSDAGIECHLASSHVRTLLGVFGPHVPIDVLVPAAVVVEARAKIGTLFQDTPLDQVFS